MEIAVLLAACLMKQRLSSQKNITVGTNLFLLRGDKMKRQILLMAALVAVSGCATVVRGTKDKFVVITEPAGAVVTTDLMTPKSKKAFRAYEKQLDYLRAEFLVKPELEFFECDATPCDFKISRRSEFTVTIEKEGYHTATIEVTSGFGKKGRNVTAGGAAVTASGAYVVTYAVGTALIETLSAVVTLGTATSNAGVSAAATGASAGLGLTMIGVDLMSGAMLDLRPNPLVVILVPLDQENPGEQSEIITSEEKVKELIAKYNRDKKAGAQARQ